MFDQFVTQLGTVGYPVHDSDATNPEGTPFTPPYYVVDGGNIARLNDRRAGKGQDPDSDHDVEFAVLSVGATANGARNMARAAIRALVGWTPDVPDRHPRPVRHVDSDAPKPDDDPRPTLWVAYDRFVFTNAR